jgi:putative nucleotidyltransferase with HDIG domain
MTSKGVQQIFATVTELPSMPASGIRMLKLLENPEASVDEIEDILRQDPGLTANVLKLANSAYFGIPTRVGSPRQAVILLGLRRLVQLVIASCVSAVMGRPVPGYDLTAGDLWRHSIAVAIAAEALVKNKRVGGVEDVFTAALLHDAGKIVLGRFVQEELPDIKRITAGGAPLVLAENMVLGTDHAQIGAKIMEAWAFPIDVVRAVRWHHDPEAADGSQILIDIVHLADLMCRKNAGIGHLDEAHGELSPAVVRRLGIAENQLEAVMGKVADWVDELSDVLTFN